MLPWPYPRILAHRGGGTLAPENTIAAIDVGRRYGLHGIEVDAMLARDQVPVLIHDPTLERTTSGRGDVSAHDAVELARLDAGAWHSAAFVGVPVPTLADAIGHCRAHDVWMNIEIKPAPGYAHLTGTVVARTVAALYADLTGEAGGSAVQVVPAVPLLSSFERDALVAARAAAPALPRGYLFERVPPNWQEELLALGCVALHTDHRHLTQALARTVKDAGYWLFCYTVDEPPRAQELFDWGVDAFCTDRVDRFGTSVPLDTRQRRL